MSVVITQIRRDIINEISCLVGVGARLNYHPNLNLIPETFSFHSDFLSAHISGWRFGALLVTFYLFNLVLLNRNWRQQKFILPSIFRIFSFFSPASQCVFELTASWRGMRSKINFIPPPHHLDYLRAGNSIARRKTRSRNYLAELKQYLGESGAR